MKAIITALFLFVSVVLHSQSEMREEMEVSISMKLESVTSVLFLTDNFVEVSNTESVIFNYYDRYIELSPGVHRLRLEVNEPVMIVLMPRPNIDIESQSTYQRVVHNGLDEVNVMSGQFLTKEYIEWTICDYFTERKVLYKN